MAADRTARAQASGSTASSEGAQAQHAAWRAAEDAPAFPSSHLTHAPCIFARHGRRHGIFNHRPHERRIVVRRSCATAAGWVGYRCRYAGLRACRLGLHGGSSPSLLAYSLPARLGRSHWHAANGAAACAVSAAALGAPADCCAAAVGVLADDTNQAGRLWLALVAGAIPPDLQRHVMQLYLQVRAGQQRT